MYIPKHWNYVARSGIVRRVRAKSAASRTTICPSVVCGGGRFFPLAGGNSAKSMYSLPRILSTSFLGSTGRPRPLGIRLCWGDGVPVSADPMCAPALPVLLASLPLLSVLLASPLLAVNVRRPSAASSSAEWLPSAVVN